MKKITLQYLLMPSELITGTESLYCKTHNSFPISLKENEICDLVCHFNLFDVGLFRKNTICTDYCIELDIEGEAEVTISSYLDNTVNESTFHIQDEVKIPIWSEKGLVGITIRAITKCTFSSGRFCGYCEDMNGLNIALCICTFNNEMLMKKKMSAVRDYYNFIGKEMPIVIIADNGSSLPQDDNVTILHSRNLGGSGGFSKAMIHAMKEDVKYIVLNDDDAIFEPEILYRLQTFISVLKDECADIIVGGTMIDSDKPTIVMESGARFVDGEHIPCKKYVDISTIQGNIVLSKAEKIDYNGWWLCAIPRSAIEEHGYPLPLFIKNDDVEYGIRLKREIIMPIGISVWHPSFVKKYSAVNLYYHIRNLLIVNSIHGSDDIINKVISSVLLEIAAYRYLSAEAMMLGIEDFMKGPSFVFNSCKNGIKKIDEERIEDLNILRSQLNIINNKHTCLSANIRKIIINGLFLPSVTDKELSIEDVSTSDFYRAGKILYDIDGTKGFIAKRNKTRTINDVKKTLRLKSLLRKKNKTLKEQYKTSFTDATSENGWNQLFQYNPKYI